MYSPPSESVPVQVNTSFRQHLSFSVIDRRARGKAWERVGREMRVRGRDESEREGWRGRDGEGGVELFSSESFQLPRVARNRKWEAVIRPNTEQG